MNRRLRRRMITRGDVSLDVEDSGGPDDWPRQSDLTLDMLKHSVHLPMEPKVDRRVVTVFITLSLNKTLTFVMRLYRLLSGQAESTPLMHVKTMLVL